MKRITSSDWKFASAVAFIMFGICINDVHCQPKFRQEINCEVPTHHVFAPHYVKGGFGFEFGRWIGENEDSKISYFAGATLTEEKELNEKGERVVGDVGSIFYVKGMYTLIRFTRVFHLYAVGSAGVENFERIYASGGARFVLPVLDKVAIAVEPMYGTRNFETYFRLCIAID